MLLGVRKSLLSGSSAVVSDDPPAPPEGMAYKLDELGNYMLDEDGAYILVPLD